MDDQRAGRALRGLRQRRRWRQADLAQQAQISQSTESLIERGHLDHLTLGTIRRAFATCDASVSLDVGWRGGELDRMLDAKRAELVAAVGRYLDEHGWNATFEVTYSHYGERGSIDVVATRGDAVLVVEVKSELTSIEATLRKLDEKARRAREIVFERTGRRPLIVGRLLVLPDTTASRGRVLGHAAISRPRAAGSGCGAARVVAIAGGRVQRHPVCPEYQHQQWCAPSHGPAEANSGESCTFDHRGG